jgi:hypothetical protein
MTTVIQASANLIRALDRLRLDDLALTRAAINDHQREVASAARARAYTLRRALQRWLASEVKAQRRPLHLDDD